MKQRLVLCWRRAARASLPVVVLAVAMLVISSPVQALQIHDLSDEWSDGSGPGTNPSSSGWQYNQDQASTAGAWGCYSCGDFTGDNAVQSGWQNPGPNHLGWSRVNAGPYPDNGGIFQLTAGDVITHGPTSFTYTVSASTAGTYDLDVSSYSIRDLNRTGFTTLQLNGSNLATDVASTCAANCSAGTGPGGGVNAAAVFSDSMVLSDGDVLKVVVGGGDYVGVNFTLTEVPEPSSFVLLTLGAVLGLIRLRRRRR